MNNTPEKYMEKECTKHGVTRFVRTTSRKKADGEYYFTYKCMACNNQYCRSKRKRYKERLVEEAGGACAICGYDKSLRALSFHHPDRSDKSFGIARQGTSRGLDALREEASKCVLVCANCHAEIEDDISRAE